MTHFTEKVAYWSYSFLFFPNITQAVIYYDEKRKKVDISSLFVPEIPLGRNRIVQKRDDLLKESCNCQMAHKHMLVHFLKADYQQKSFHGKSYLTYLKY